MKKILLIIAIITVALIVGCLDDSNKDHKNINCTCKCVEMGK